MRELSEYLRWMAGDAADQEALAQIVDELVPISSESEFEASVEPTHFDIEALGWQDITLTINTGQSATFFAALRFTSDSGKEYLTDLMSASTVVAPASAEQVLERAARRACPRVLDLGRPLSA